MDCVGLLSYALQYSRFWQESLQYCFPSNRFLRERSDEERQEERDKEDDFSRHLYLMCVRIHRVGPFPARWVRQIRAQ